MVLSLTGSFNSQHVITSNYDINIKKISAMVRRTIRCRFYASFTEGIVKENLEELKAEQRVQKTENPNILEQLSTPLHLTVWLNWMLEGLLEFNKKGLQPTETMKADTETIFAEHDSAADFLHRYFENSTCNKGYPTEQMYEEYAKFCKGENNTNSLKALDKRNFRIFMKQNNYQTRKMRYRDCPNPIACYVNIAKRIFILEPRSSGN